MKSSGGALGTRIRELREQTGLSQEQVAAKIGVLRSTLSQMENGDRKVTADDLLRLARFFNVSADELLDVKKPLRVTLAAGERPAPPVEPTERIHVPQEHVKKFKEVLLYILNRVGSKPHVGETVIYKLLYFIDFDYYERYEAQLVGATYIKNHYGPTPVEFKKIVDQMIKEGALEKVRSTYFSFPQTKYLPRRGPDVSVLNAREVMLVDEVLCRLSDKNATEISEWSHKDVPWQTAEDGQPIEYESVFYRTAPYSARIADEHTPILRSPIRRSSRRRSSPVVPSRDSGAAPAFASSTPTKRSASASCSSRSTSRATRNWRTGPGFTRT